jgi:hypothetical protein
MSVRTLSTMEGGSRQLVMKKLNKPVITPAVTL